MLWNSRWVSAGCVRCGTSVERQSDGDNAPAAIGAVELKAMVVAVEGLEALLHVGEPHAAALRERVGIRWTGAIVGHAQVQAVVHAARFEGEVATRLARHDGVAHGVFHERLQDERRHAR
jgi:hypothetical protein